MKSDLIKRRAAKPDLKGVRRVLPQIQTLIEASRQHVVSTANLTLVWLYWNVGRVITVDIQQNQKRAGYGQRLIEQLAVRLTHDYGRGFSSQNLWDMKRFVEGFEILPTVPGEFINAHRLPSLLAAPSDSKIRSSVTGKSAPVQILPTVSGESSDRILLDFLGLKGAYSEKDFESAILANLQQFLAELGSDFCFVARQFAMRIDDDDYWLDLLFYHRRLRCLVAIDLKIGPFVAADKGQMDLYLSWLKKHDWREGENEPAGLILCTSKKHQHVELLLSHGPHKMQVSEYLTQLPSKRVLTDRLKIYSRILAEQDRGEK